MKKNQKSGLAFLFFVFCLLSFGESFAQEGMIPSLKFKDADIRVVLQAIAQRAVRDGKEVNILLCPEVKGLVNVDLSNVDWQTALSAVLKTYDYGYEWVGDNIILVDTLESLTAKRQRAQEAKVAEPLDTRIFALSFAKVQEIEGSIQGMLTSRGKFSSDPRTNIVVITDTQSNLDNIAKAVKSLDAVTPQVLIEAKIIETNLAVSNKIGVKWNIGSSADGAAATSITGSTRPHLWPFTKHSDNKYLFEDDFPAALTGFAYGTLDASNFNLALQILFEDTNTKILSMPKITTMDNHEATIDVITEDPVPNYTYNSENQSWEIAGYDWIKYGVSLTVTPYINREGFVTLEVEPRISERLEDREFTSGGSTAYIPKLYTQTTTTKVMIKDKETLVIGGLIKDKKVDTINKIPLLGDIPILGYLFKHKSKTIETKNLLIFITPTIVTPEIIIAK